MGVGDEDEDVGGGLEGPLSSRTSTCSGRKTARREGEMVWKGIAGVSGGGSYNTRQTRPSLVIYPKTLNPTRGPASPPLYVHITPSFLVAAHTIVYDYYNTSHYTQCLSAVHQSHSAAVAPNTAGGFGMAAVVEAPDPAPGTRRYPIAISPDPA